MSINPVSFIKIDDFYINPNHVLAIKDKKNGKCGVFFDQQKTPSDFTSQYCKLELSTKNTNLDEVLCPKNKLDINA